MAARDASVDDVQGMGQDQRWISPLGWGLAALAVGLLAIAGLLGHLLTDRLTVHNRTTQPVSFTVDSFGSYPNYVGACSSSEFRWQEDGSRSGWTPAGGRDWQGGAVEIEIGVERWFEFRGYADRFAVLVTKDGVTQLDSEASLPVCVGVAPQ